MATSDSLQRDAESLYAAATAFIRQYQFRDRDQALRYGLTVTQAYVLDAIAGREEGLHLKALVELLQSDKSTLSRVIAGMEQRGLVRWSRPEFDRRIKYVMVTPEGQRRYAKLRRSHVRANAALLASYTAKERKSTIELLQQLARRP